MDPTALLASLNTEQREAVTAPVGNYLVLAGAGSGKTRVLVHRMAWLLAAENSPFGIFAVTFTNKSAHEMLERVQALLGPMHHAVWVGTFHGLAHRFLRMHWQEAGLVAEFQIMDSDDQLRLIRRVMKEVGVDENHFQPKQVQWYINSKKDEGLRADHIQPGFDPYSKTMVVLYQGYEAACKRAHLVDFAELLLRTHEMFGEHPELLAHYQSRFQHFLVDEFQDTNAIQYAWLKRLAGSSGKMMMVGDDDQSIYGWRGAKIENIHRFTKEFADVTVFRLERNYRSSENILAAANSVIENNPDRLGKALWTEKGKGEKISLYHAINEIEEAQFVVSQIISHVNTGTPYPEIAVLYRSNAQSRVLEEALIQANIPYRIYGGQRFFERAEIKDALAYLRLVYHVHDDAAFERVVNWPTRGIGEKTLLTIREQAKQAGTSLWLAAQALLEALALGKAGSESLQAFMRLIADLAQDICELSLPQQVDTVIARSGLIIQYQKEKGEKGHSRIENLQELVTAAQSFKPEDTDVPNSPLSAFLSHASLEAGDAQASPEMASVQLLTLHSAKGLEFSVVCMVGLEEGLFPHQMSIKEGKGVEEERRLCYVGMTRAKEKLIVSFVEERRLYGQSLNQRPSRFLAEMPQELLEPVRLTMRTSTATNKATKIAEYKKEDTGGLYLGERVQHPKFGDGVVMHFEGDGDHLRVQVRFKSAGEKWLVAKYANLEKAAY